MLKQRKRHVEIFNYVLSTFLFMVVSYFILPKITLMLDPVYFCMLEFVLLVFFLIMTSAVTKTINKSIEDRVLRKEETKYIQMFIDSLRFCYTLEDFYEIIQTVLEQKADCSVLYIDSEKEYVLYNSPNRITCDKDVLRTLQNNFPSTWPDGFDFVGDKLGITSKYFKARGFVLSVDKFHFFVLCRFTRFFDTGIYKQLLDEFIRFRKRTQTISSLSEIASLSKEWEQLAETQRLFLPAVMPDTKRLKIAAYFRPLVNVSGDYYTALPIDEHKTLLMLGDVSGKGLPAALIMGLVMNTVKIIEDKEDLITIVRAIDKAIKGMKLQDKYTVLFISVVDTQKMTIRYVNASMSDPLIVTRAPDGYTIKPLSSNCGVVGIIDIDDIRIDEQRLFRDDLILFASDGVSEVMNDEGVELGDTDLYTDTIRNSAAKQPQEFIDDIVKLIFDYKGNNKLHDDITMMVTKVVS
ncbi:PP2C family protein-serine/threonine phosphatase [Treponema sp.]|uniref:PP2C family protein-serine/threonine phosphatase n=1 Tax=Treponema sp. TaxID=166 RepID=UPI00298DEDFB|nr:SpoIIE family protein phosphatase [Treponema sp.]MCR5612628.1 SpoIIE family protein phosphatase [Treponema sp.]